ncbi:uncharacterized protein TRAVEDRAFT_163820 [Trametes versicolor FP-101664 SS1]|uniref:uncharacterized protein n=1 Tax=Trametes versicolor (strain FP-101664) TaxID=717944 RepID=UPI000462220D|nr:uncharacterized protein TRAVEDRAFT_163820 [Trametes versicolor FP-101664 SS1]EIW62068.1 hypothetical protein TRAVEDRAFT_163820 [Trametes versicolor FP-101664 SS1]
MKSVPRPNRPGTRSRSVFSSVDLDCSSLTFVPAPLTRSGRRLPRGAPANPGPTSCTRCDRDPGNATSRLRPSPAPNPPLVESVDHEFQQRMVDMLKQTGRSEMVVGWYHSHPGFGCWLSSVDINTQQSFEQLDRRAVAVVVDPIQSVKGKVVIDAFRLINPAMVLQGLEPRQTTSNIGHINKPSIQALIHGLNRHYYSIAVNYRKTELEQAMLMNLHKRNWTEGLTLRDFKGHKEGNEKAIKSMLSLSSAYNKSVQEESTLSADQLKTRHVGKQDPKRHLEEQVEKAIGDQVVQNLGTMLLAEL